MEEITIDPIHLQSIQEILSEALPERKRSQISEQDIVNEYNRLKSDGLFEESQGEDFTYKYFPLKSVELVVCSFVSKLKDAEPKRKPVENMNNFSSPDNNLSCSELSLSSQPKKSKFEPEKEKVKKSVDPSTMMASLMNLYPDIDPPYLKSVVDKNVTCEDVQDYIEKNLDKIPERRSIQAIQYQVLQLQLEKDEELWQCPGCRSWQKIQKSDQDIFCAELNSCGSYCKSCRVKSHQPFDCRTSTVRQYYPEKGDETDIFKLLTTPPSLVKPTFRVFIMMPRNETDYSNPLDILYTAAEGTFLKMLKIAGDGHFSVPPSASSSFLPPLPPRHPSSSSMALVTNPISTSPSAGLILSSSSSTASDTAVSSTSSAVSIPSPPEQMRQNPSYSHLFPGSGTPSPPPPAPSTETGSSSSSPSVVGDSSSTNQGARTGREIRMMSAYLANAPSSQSVSVASAVIPSVSPAPRSFGPGLPPPIVNYNPPPFARMLGMDVNRKIFDRSFIKEIHYFENDNLAERFRRCKDRMEASGFPCKERLVFHGTSADIDSIMEKGFLMSMCKRSAHGVGIYFSEFPNVSKMYGKTLLLCRVLVGKPFYGPDKTIPPGFNSKIVRPDGDGKAKMIVINKEDQILPAFQVKVEWDSSS